MKEGSTAPNTKGRGLGLTWVGAGATQKQRGWLMGEGRGPEVTARGAQ